VTGIVAALVILPLVVGPAVLVGRLAVRKGRSGLLFFLFAVLLLWPAALVTLMVLGDADTDGTPT
jgi:hypothetical protein